MRTLSRLSLLSNKIHRETSKKSVLGTLVESMLQSKHVHLNIRVPYYDVLRGQVFINDLEVILGDEMIVLTVEDLFALLYEDFLSQIRRGADMKSIANWLMGLKERYKEGIFEEITEMVQKNPYSFTFVQKRQPKKQRKENKPVELPIAILRKEADRGEVLLYEMGNLVSHFNMTLEELISVRYQDFINEVKEGNEKVINAV